jgi:6-phosphogluconate dehydrogenase (decarboxylating)
MKVGFIGLGSRGAGMSRNLIKAGHDLVAYNRTRSLAQEMRSLGAKAADSASEAAVGAAALITMLADDRVELAPQIHAISDETHRKIHSLLTDHQKELEKAMQQREHDGKKTGDLLRS